MSLQKRELAQQIASLQLELSQIVEIITKIDNELGDDARDYIHTLRLRSVVLERDIDQLQKQFINLPHEQNI